MTLRYTASIPFTMTPLQRLQQAFINALGLEPATAVENLAYGTDESWDSVAHMRLIAELEETFGIMIDTDDVIDMSSFQKAKEILAKYDVQLGA